MSKRMDSTASNSSFMSNAADFISKSTSNILLDTTWTPLIKFVQGKIFDILNEIKIGELILETPDGEKHFFGSSGSKPCSVLIIKSHKFWVRLALYKDLGLAESFMADECEINDITQLLKVLVLNRESISLPSSSLTSQIFGALNYAINTRFINSISNSLSNISAHYDLGNEMFSLFLDDTLTYSCPIWEENNTSNNKEETCSLALADEFDLLAKAQLRKLHTIIKKAKLKESDHLLEIGTGWGSLAIEAVKMSGCRVTTITLSAEQKALAEKRIHEAGLSSNITVLLMDYRDLETQGIIYDKIISIEMIEAVGREFLVEYFRVCDSVLSPRGGIMVFQCITLHEGRYDDYCKQVDFIQKYIFPGGETPTVTLLVNAIQKGSSSTMIVDDMTNIGAHYTKALRLWRLKFDQNFPLIQKHDPARYNDRFKRTWDYYFSYCEAGFATHCLGDVIAVLTRPNNPLILEGVPM